MDMLRRQVAVEGGCGEMGYGESGGIFSAKARAGAASYQAFRKMHPGLPREELSAMWQRHKMGGAMVGGFPGQRAMFKYVREQHPHAGKEELHGLFEKERKLYAESYPGYVPKRRAATQGRVPKSLQAKFTRARKLSMLNPDCPPFVGINRGRKSDVDALLHRLERLEMKQEAAAPVAAAVAKRVLGPSAAEALEMVYPEEPNPAIEEYLGELGLGLAGGRRRRLRR